MGPSRKPGPHVIDNSDAPTPQEINDDPTSVNQPNAPTAAITAMDTSVPEGMLNLQVVAPYKALYKAVSMPAKKR